MFVQKCESLIKSYVEKQKFLIYPVHNVQEFYEIFVRIPFITSKTENFIWYKKIYTQDVSWLPNNLGLRILESMEILSKDAQKKFKIFGLRTLSLS